MFHAFCCPGNDEPNPNSMKILVCLLAFACLWAPGRSFAAQRDSLGHGRLAVAAVPLIMGGAAMTFCDRDFRDLRNSYAVGFRHDYDDYLQYAPLAFAWGLKACGVRSRSSWGRMIVSNAFSAALMAAMANSLKYSVRAERPTALPAILFRRGMLLRLSWLPLFSIRSSAIAVRGSASGGTLPPPLPALRASSTTAIG